MLTRGAGLAAVLNEIRDEQLCSNSGSALYLSFVNGVGVLRVWCFRSAWAGRWWEDSVDRRVVLSVSQGSMVPRVE